MPEENHPYGETESQSGPRKLEGFPDLGRLYTRFKQRSPVLCPEQRLFKSLQLIGSALEELDVALVGHEQLGQGLA